jgi:hypothetical protein
VPSRAVRRARSPSVTSASLPDQHGGASSYAFRPMPSSQQSSSFCRRRNHDDAESRSHAARWIWRAPALYLARLPPASLAGRNTASVLGHLRFLRLRRRVSRTAASSGSRSLHRARRARAAAFAQLAGGGEIDLLSATTPSTLERWWRGAARPLCCARRRSSARCSSLRAPAPPACERRRPPGRSSSRSFRDGQSSAVVLVSTRQGRLVRTLRDQHSAQSRSSRRAFVSDDGEPPIRATWCLARPSASRISIRPANLLLSSSAGRCSLGRLSTRGP